MIFVEIEIGYDSNIIIINNQRNQNWKRKHHIKKSFSQYIRNEERTSESHTLIDYLKYQHLDVLLNIVVAIVVSVLSSGCFFVLIPGSVRLILNE